MHDCELCGHESRQVVVEESSAGSSPGDLNVCKAGNVDQLELAFYAGRVSEVTKHDAPRTEVEQTASVETLTITITVLTVEEQSPVAHPGEHEKAKAEVDG